jgi:hypothetical protein
MPKDSQDGHLFLSPLKRPTGTTWFKKGVNLSECSLRVFIRDMAAKVGMKGDYTNKSRRVTSITRMCIAQVPLEAIVANTGHKNVKNIQRYNRINCLKTRSAQSLARPLEIGQQRDFNNHYNAEVSEWHEVNTGTNCNSSVVVSESRGDEAVAEQIEFNIEREIELSHESLLSTENACSIDDQACPLVSEPHQAVNLQPSFTSPIIPSTSVSAHLGPAVSGPLTAISGPASAPSALVTQAATTVLTPTNAPSGPSHDAGASSTLFLQTSTSLVEEEISFYKDYILSGGELDLDNTAPSANRVAEAPSGKQ